MLRLTLIILRYHSFAYIKCFVAIDNFINERYTVKKFLLVSAFRKVAIKPMSKFLCKKCWNIVESKVSVSLSKYGHRQITITTINPNPVFGVLLKISFSLLQHL
jgi:hypothetical protein